MITSRPSEPSTRRPPCSPNCRPETEEETAPMTNIDAQRRGHGADRSAPTHSQVAALGAVPRGGVGGGVRRVVRRRGARRVLQAGDRRRRGCTTRSRNSRPRRPGPSPWSCNAALVSAILGAALGGALGLAGGATAGERGWPRSGPRSPGLCWGRGPGSPRRAGRCRPTSGPTSRSPKPDPSVARSRRGLDGGRWGRGIGLRDRARRGAGDGDPGGDRRRRRCGGGDVDLRPRRRRGVPPRPDVPADPGVVIGPDARAALRRVVGRASAPRRPTRAPRDASARRPRLRRIFARRKPFLDRRFGEVEYWGFP